MTRKTKRNILLVVLLIGIAGAAIAYKMWNKPFADPLSGKAIEITAEQLFADFVKDEPAARKKYVPEVISDITVQVTGEVKEVKTNESGEISYILKGDDDMSEVKCVMEKQKDSQTIKPGDQIKVRGFCNGYTGDPSIPGIGEVIIGRCKIVK